MQAGIIAQTLEDASNIFKDKLKFTFDNLDPRIRPFFQTVGDSAKELAFKHGSVIRVGTSLRGHTLQYLHISEFGKICAKDPEKAREIVTGSLNTVHVGQNIFIESTAEGREVYFFDMCQIAEEKAKLGSILGPMDFKFRFFPWHMHPEYYLESVEETPEELKEYFDKLYLRGISITDQQKYWYIKKWKYLREDMTREFPSFSEEAFSASQEGYWYASQMRQLHQEGHITNVSYDRALPVYTAWDLGQRDKTAIWFFQINRAGEIMIFDYFEKNNVDLASLVSILQTKGYTYGQHIWPLDASARDRAGITFVQQAASFNVRGLVLEQHAFPDGVRLVRSTLPKCWFDQKRCKEGISALENYKKKWSPSLGGWSSEPLHDESSHGADAFRYLCAGLAKIRASSSSLEGDAKALRAFWGG